MLVIIAALFFTLFYPPLLLSLDIPKISLPKLRNFIYFNSRETEIRGETFSKFQSLVHGKFRIIQFNMLADGLSGLRADLGAFSRAKKEDVCWESRKVKILYELLQYDPDVITLQECDHYYDFFLPALSAKGYDGIFAPKPASACLEVSENSDGCAIFVRRSKFLIRSSEVH
jgi:mRNA deadenylase 3'-5' endonuclease subunit Ccr4